MLLARDGGDVVLSKRDELVRLGMISPTSDREAPDSTRERLLAAALEMFADRGFEGCTMRDLAAAVGVKAPAIYNHYSSKEDILDAAASRALGNFFTVVIGPLNLDRPEERLEMLVKRWLQVQLSEPVISRAIDALLDTGTLERLLPDDSWQVTATALRLLLEIMAELIVERGAEGVRPELAALCITAVCDRATRLYREGGPLPQSDLVDETWALCERMLESR